MSTILSQPLPMPPVRPLGPPSPLPREIVAAVTRWQSLRKTSWLIADASPVMKALSRAREIALETGRESLSRALEGLSLYLGFLVDSGALAPTSLQLQRLAKLEEAILILLRGERALAVVPDERKLLLLLVPETALWQAIIDRLDRARFRVERFADTALLLGKFGSVAPVAVLIDEQFLRDLQSVADSLEGWRASDSLGATVLYFNRNRDFAARNGALSAGADTSLEGEDVDYLVTRVVELIRARERQENLRVLIVEDDRSQALYCELILRKQGINVKVASEARQALAAIHEFAPDLVLMDLHIPDLDGLQLTEMIRDDPRLALLPVIFLTGDEDEGTRFNALHVGGDDYLLKPVTPRHLVTAVVSRARRARNLKQQFADRAVDVSRPRLCHTGEFIATLRRLGHDRPCRQALLLCAPDRNLTTVGRQNEAAACELWYQTARQIETGLADDERIAPWPDGGYLLLLERTADAQLLPRAEAVRQQIANATEAGGFAGASLAIVPLQSEALPSAESLIELAERTLDIARHAGGTRVQQALAELPTDLPAELSLAIQKALAMPPAAASLSVLYQPIVALHGAQRPQYHLRLGLLTGDSGERRVRRSQWLALARQTGCCQALDLYAVGKALDCVQSSRKALPGMRVYVDVDASSLVEPAFVQALLDGLEQRQLTDPGLVLAIDHSEAISVQKRMEAARSQLRAARVLLCLRHVDISARGSQVIEALQPEILTVDANALRVCAQAPPILGFAHAHGAELIAYGIPDANTLARSFAMRVDYGMGNFVGAARARLDYDFGEH